MRPNRRLVMNRRFIWWGVTASRDGRLQLIAFGARDRAFFEAILESAPRRQLKRRALGRTSYPDHAFGISFAAERVT